VIPEETRMETVADMVDENKQWKWEEFAHLLPGGHLVMVVRNNVQDC